MPPGLRRFVPSFASSQSNPSHPLQTMVWLNLNSLQTRPELISPTFLSLFLTQLIQEGSVYPSEFSELVVR